MIDQYLQQEAERGALGIPARPLDPEQTAEVLQASGKPAGREGGVPPAPSERTGLSRCRSGRRGKGGIPGGNSQRLRQLPARLRTGGDQNPRRHARRL